jgi:tRNA (guanine37-N1)-methyltransferase
MSLKDNQKKYLEPWKLKHLKQSYDIIGDIAVIRIPEIKEQKTREIAETIMHNNPYIKTILRQTGPVTGELRLRKLKYIMGENKTETTHKEFGCLFKVNLEKCYFSPRLSFERMRIARQVANGEVVVNMFAGVGCFSILIAKYASPRKIYSIDVNSEAIGYMEENIRLNKVRYVVDAVVGDAKDVIAKRMLNVADRVLMPLPEKAFEYLDYALLALKPTGGKIHYYDFVHAEKCINPIEEVEEKVSKKLQRMHVFSEYSFGRIVRTVGPRWFQVVLDIKIH